jgi:hypothetical protein
MEPRLSPIVGWLHLFADLDKPRTVRSSASGYLRTLISSHPQHTVGIGGSPSSHTEHHLPTVCSQKLVLGFCQVVSWCTFPHAFQCKYGRFRPERIQETRGRLRTSGDYSQGNARIKCNNRNCDHQYFRPRGCMGRYLYLARRPQRTLPFAEHLTRKELLIPRSDLIGSPVVHILSRQRLASPPQEPVPGAFHL